MNVTQAAFETHRTDRRIAEWVKMSRENCGAMSPLMAFDRAIRDMREAGYRIPANVVAGVRAELMAR